MALRTNVYVWFLVHLIFVTVLLHTAQTQNETSESTTSFDYFDCRRAGVSCGDVNQCNLNSGQCVCSSNSTNYMCEQPGSHCPEDKYGEDCSFKRVDVVCSSTGMLVNVNPYGNFQGIISVYSKSNQISCSFQNITTINATGDGYGEDYKKWSGYGINLNHMDSTCGDATKEETADWLSHTRLFIVQYSPNFVSAVDQIITAKCTSRKGNLTVSGSIPSVVNQDQLLNGLKNLTVDDDVDAVTFKISRAGGETIDNKTQVVLGEKIELLFEGSQKFRLVKCVANNTENKTADLITDSCPDEKAKSLFYDNILTSNASGKFQVILRLKAFRFTGNNTQVAFVCNINLCAENDTGCHTVNCSNFSAAVPLTTPAPATTTTPTTTTSASTIVGNDTLTNNSTDFNDTAADTTTPSGLNGTGPSVRRRRRSAADGSTTVTNSMTVVDRLDQLPADTKSSTTNTGSTDCPQDKNLIALAIILSIFVAISIVSIGLLVYMSLISKSKDKVHSDTSHVPAEPVQTMRIPRLELHSTSLNQPC